MESMDGPPGFETEGIMAERTAVYRIFGEADLLLYIGVSKNFGRRWQQHAKTQPWWDEHRRMTVEWHDSRDAAEAAEAIAINAEKPQYNIGSGVLVINENAEAMPPAGVRDDLAAVVEWILATPRLPPAEIRLALARPLYGAPPASGAEFVAYAMRIGVGHQQAYQAARRRRQPRQPGYGNRSDSPEITPTETVERTLSDKPVKPAA
jgi:predicted GIY-YIG superfamily endonuclease